MKSLRILIVEDEILIADTIQRYLEQAGHEVVGIAISFEEAIELYLEQSPDMALLDIRLSGSKSGIDFAHFLLMQAKQIPFIYLTSQMDRENLDRAKKTFPVGYLSKPIQKESLWATIEIGMHSFEANEKLAQTIALTEGNKNFNVQYKDILYLEADHIYVRVHLGDEKNIMQRTSLKEFLEKLPNNQFLQIHRSFAINVNRVSRWDLQNVYLENRAIPLSRSRRKDFLAQLNN